MRKFIIVDLDNCISDDRHRRGYILKDHPEGAEKYEEYHNQCHQDRMVASDELRQQLSSNNVLVFTSRSHHVKDKTLAWLEQNGIKPYLLLMRPKYNIEISPVLKAGMLNFVETIHGVNPENTLACYDDRQDILDVYIAKGYNAQIVKIDEEYVK